MQTTIVKLSSITHATKIKKMLNRIGIEAKLVKVSDSKNYNGCIYALKFDTENYYSVVALLQKSQIPYTFN